VELWVEVVRRVYPELTEPTARSAVHSVFGLGGSGSSGCARDAAASGHWTGRRARQVMRSAFDWWLEWEQEGHPRRLIDLNFLAHAKVCEGRGAEAAALFHRIGDHATPSPWSYPDRDPYSAFRAARDTALGTA
ncbi:hypothetical protein ACWDRX_34905, partial [Streptomyces nigra]